MGTTELHVNISTACKYPQKVARMAKKFKFHRQVGFRLGCVEQA